MTRRDRLRAWWETARSTYEWNQWEARFWVATALAGVAWRPLRESIPALFFMSAYANSKASTATAQSAKIEMKEEEAADHGE